MQIDQSRILLVEDEPHDVELIQLALDDYNFVNQIDVVNDGEKALHYLLGKEGDVAKHPLPKLILLDLKLPKIKGTKVLEAIRSHPHTHNLVVVVMTSSQEDRDLNECYKLGVNSYIVKPLDFEQFTEVARQTGMYWMLLNKAPVKT